MGIPSIVGFLITVIYNFVDAIFVGRLGTNAMGAASVVFLITLIMIVIGLFSGSAAISDHNLTEEKIFKDSLK